MAVTATVVAYSSIAAAVGFYAPVYPSGQSMQGEVIVSYQPGDWLVCFCAWHQAAGSDVTTVSVADDAHNWWEPLGTPTGTSSAAGTTRCSIWVAPAAKVAGFISVGPSDFILSGAFTVVAVTGLEPWMTVTGVLTAYANAATSLSALALAAPASQAFFMTACASDLNSATISLAGSGWTAITPIVTDNGTNTSSDLTLTPYWQASTGSVSATWSSNASLDMSAVIAGFLVSGTALSQPNAYWPLTITEMAPGTGVQATADTLSWAQLVSRNLSVTMQQGRQYQLAQLQAGQGQLVLDDPDGALIPGQPFTWQLSWHGNGSAATPGAVSGLLAVTAGQGYSFGAWIEAGATWAAGAYVYLDWRTSGNSHISYSYGTVTATMVSTPGFSAVCAPAPATATQVLAGVAISGTPPSSTTFYAAAGPSQSLQGTPLTVPATVTWAAADSATVATLEPWTAVYNPDSATPVRVRQYWAGGAWQVEWAGNGSTADPQIVTGYIAVSASTSYYVAAWTGISASSTGMTMYVAWYTSGMSLISDSSTTAGATGTTATLITLTATSPSNAAYARVVIYADGTPATTLTFYAAAAPAGAPAGSQQLVIPPGVSWTFGNSATGSTLAPWSPDRRGPPNITPWAVPVGAYLQQLPPSWDQNTYRGMTQVTLTDILGYANGNLQNIIRVEYENDNPYAYWPCTDPAAATAASNIAAGNISPLYQTVSKYGLGAGTAAFGQNSGAVFGDTGTIYSTTSQTSTEESTMWGQTIFAGQAFTANDASPCVFTLASGSTGYTAGTYVYISGDLLPGGFITGKYYVVSPSGLTFELAATSGGTPIDSTSAGSGVVTTSLQTQQGAALTCTDVNFPPIADGVTIEAWWTSTAVLYESATIFCAGNSAGPVLQLVLQNGTGTLGFNYWPAGSSTSTFVTIVAADFANDPALWQVAVSFNQNTYTAYLQGGDWEVTGSFSSPLPAQFTFLECGGRVDHQVTGAFMAGYIGHVAVFPVLLQQVRLLNHYIAGTFACGGDSASVRMERLLRAAGLQLRRNILVESQSSSDCVSCQDVGGQPAATSLANISGAFPPGFMYVAPNGDLCYLAHDYAYDNPVSWVLGEEEYAGEYQYGPDFAYGYDPARIANFIQLTQLDSQAVVTPTVQALESWSQAKYGVWVLQQTGYVDNTPSSAYTAGPALQDAANWIAETFDAPYLRVVSATVDAGAYPIAWPYFMSVSPGDMATVNRRPPTGPPGELITMTGRVIQVSRALTFGAGGVTGAVTVVVDTAPEQYALTLDDTVRGLLNGTDVLAW
jgi:hypothetical protein